MITKKECFDHQINDALSQLKESKIFRSTHLIILIALIEVSLSELIFDCQVRVCDGKTCYNIRKINKLKH
jgi:hypothetical protein